MPKKSASKILSIDGQEVQITNPEKLFFSSQIKVTKLELVQYYLSIAPGALAGIQDRPIVLKRFVNGAEAEAHQVKAVGAQGAHGELAEFLGIEELIDPSASRPQSSSGSTASEALDRANMQWGDCLPGNPHDLWKWCLQQPQDILLDLLACCAACTVQSKSDSVDNERSLHADRLAAALRLDMAVWFTPTAANYFRRISKTGILAAFQE